MNGKIKTDYLKFIFHRTNVDLTRYSISASDKDIINKLFGKIISSNNLHRDLYILSHTKELNNIGKYFIFILKKIEDKVINYDNLSLNLKTDIEFIENEILSYLSNPKLRDSINQKFEDGAEEIFYPDLARSPETKVEDLSEVQENPGEDAEEEKDIASFKEKYLDKKNYLELIQSEEENNEIVYELPETDGNKNSDDNNLAFELPKKENKESEDKIILSEDKTAEVITEDKNKVDASDESNSSFIIKGIIRNEETEIREDNQTGQTLFNEDIKSDKFEKEDNQIKNESAESDKDSEKEEEKIQLSDEIQEEINTYAEEQKNLTEEENIFKVEEEISVEPLPNALFIEYENQVKEKNEYLNYEFDRMINIVNEKYTADEERNEIIKNIIDTSIQLEGKSRNLSLEIISNIYQTITLSFEKISDGKYDISQSTINLFKNGLLLVISLIRGDDYFGYKDILKSIENVRNGLIEERQRRERYLKLKQEKTELERKLSQKYPGESQRLRIASMKQLIKDTEINFNNLEKISGEYQIYEALRILSGNLSNFKEIVKLSKELGMKKLLQLSEAGYIFIKFLQNYRINPVTTETKEIFGYIIYNLKSLVMEKEVKDIDLFISYLNDPVKIFSKTDKKKS